MNGCRVDALHLGIGSLPLTKETFIPSGVGQRMDAPSLLERYITTLAIPVIGLAIVLLPFIAFVLYTWWSQRRRR
jgi:hypothetical protein